MRMKSKPQKPTQKRHYDRDRIWEGISVQELMDQYGPNATIEMNWGDGYDHLVVCYECIEGDEFFAKRMADYERRMSKWREWYDENKAEVEAEKARRAEAKLAKETRQKQATIKRLEKELAKLKKEK